MSKSSLVASLDLLPLLPELGLGGVREKTPFCEDEEEIETRVSSAVFFSSLLLTN